MKFWNREPYILQFYSSSTHLRFSTSFHVEVQRRFFGIIQMKVGRLKVEIWRPCTIWCIKNNRFHLYHRQPTHMTKKSEPIKCDLTFPTPWSDSPVRNMERPPETLIFRLPSADIVFARWLHWEHDLISQLGWPVTAKHHAVDGPGNVVPNVIFRCQFVDGWFVRWTKRSSVLCLFHWCCCRENVDRILQEMETSNLSFGKLDLTLVPSFSISLQILLDIFQIFLLFCYFFTEYDYTAT